MPGITLFLRTKNQSEKVRKIWDSRSLKNISWPIIAVIRSSSGFLRPFWSGRWPATLGRKWPRKKSQGFIWVIMSQYSTWRTRICSINSSTQKLRICLWFKIWNSEFTEEYPSGDFRKPKDQNIKKWKWMTRRAVATCTFFATAKTHSRLTPISSCSFLSKTQ